MLYAKLYEDEVFCGLLLLMQKFYLDRHDATFEENFYGFKRLHSTQGDEKKTSDEEFTRHDKLLSLLVSVGFPYTLLKLEKLRSRLISRDRDRNEHRNRDEERDGEKESRSRSRRLTLSEALVETFITVIPYMRRLQTLSALCFDVLYAFNKTSHPSLVFWMFKWKLRRLQFTDYERSTRLEQETYNNSSAIGKFFSQLLGGFKLLLAFSALGFKVFEFYYSSENVAEREAQRQKRGETIDPPMPSPLLPSYASSLAHRGPKEALVAQGVSSLPSTLQQEMTDDLCLLCFETMKTPCISTSGFVFCFSCLKKFVLQNGCCPATGLSCTLKQIRKIYEI